MRLRLLCTAFAVMLLATPSFALPIVDTIGTTSIAGGGFWIGAFEIDPYSDYIGPDGYDRFVVAQTFEAYRDYTDVTGRVGLWSTGLTDAVGAPVSVSFTLSADAGGVPGASLATTNVVLTSSSMTVYDLAFEGLSLVDGTRYWLVASSPNVQYGFGSPRCCAGAVPIWGVAPIWADALAYQQNGASWITSGSSFLFALDGTLVGDPVANGDGPGERPTHANVPEPSTLFLMVLALALRSRIRRPGRFPF